MITLGVTALSVQEAAQHKEIARITPLHRNDDDDVIYRVYIQDGWRKATYDIQLSYGISHKFIICVLISVSQFCNSLHRNKARAIAYTMYVNYRFQQEYRYATSIQEANDLIIKEYPAHRIDKYQKCILREIPKQRARV